MRIWTVTAPPVWAAEEEALLLRWMPPRRRERLAACRPEDYAVRLAAYALEGAAAFLAAGIPPEEQRYGIGEHGKPFLQGGGAYCYNLSHTGNRVLLGSADEEIGVDIERIRSFSSRLLERCFSPQERARAGTDEAATALWTRKEAACKRDGRGLAAGLRTVPVLEGEADGRLFTARDEEYMLSVCCGEAQQDPDWRRLDGGALCAMLQKLEQEAADMEKQETGRGQWIWYPGDFEMLLGLRMWSSRTERGMMVTPNWKVETFYPNVKFRRTFELTEEAVLDIRADGLLNVEVDGRYIYEYRQGVRLEPGRHTLALIVFNDKELPSVYIDHPAVYTDNHWEASCVEGKWVMADSWNFTDPQTPPSAFSLPVEPVRPVSRRREGQGTLYDFGREYMAFVRFDGVGGEGIQPVAYGESLEEALDVRGCELYDEVPLPQTRQTDNTRAFRYIYLPDVPGLRVADLTILSQYLPLENRGCFRCEDDTVNRIYDTALYTLRLNSREFFLDGIKRDRWVWSGDAAQSYLLDFYSFFDTALCRRTIRLLRGKDPIQTHLNTIQDYTCYWFISLYDYYQYTGDRDFLVRLYDDARGLMDYCRSLTDERGFLMAQPGDWVFIDWAPIETKGDISVIQILYARALESMALIAGLCGKPEEERAYTAMFRQTLDAAFAHFWSEEKGCFTHGPAAAPGAVVTRYANLFALLFGYLREDRAASAIRAALLNDEILPITTPYMKFYELMALCEAGETGRVLDYMREYWGGMLKLGATTIWEEYVPSRQGAEHYAMYGRPYGKSLCHAWGGGPLVLLGKYFLGVRPTAPGYARFAVEPHTGGLERMEGVVPTPDGDIRVTVERDWVRVESRTAGEGTLRWQGKCWTIPPYGTVDTER